MNYELRRKLCVIFSALLLAPLGTLHAGRNLLEVPMIGKARAEKFQALENTVAMTSNDWN